MTATPTAFWDDLAEDLKNPEFRRHYIRESERIAAIDWLVNRLDELREEQGLSKADLARAIDRKPETVRRLFTAKGVNPQLALVTEMASVLGYRVTLEPINAASSARSNRRRVGRAS